LRTRFGVEVSLGWQEGVIETVVLAPTRDVSLILAQQGQTLELDLKKGQEVHLIRSGEVLVPNAPAGE